MARYTGPQCRLCRREGIKLYLKGDRCYTSKCAIERRPYAPGAHGQARRKISEYGMQLREKQKARRIYGVLETQFRNYFERAERQPGITGENLLRLLERRLDNVVYRLGLATSRMEARQLVRHGHFTVNGRRVNIPSYLVRVGDVIAVREKSKESPRIKELMERAADRTPPPWLEYDENQVQGRVVALPTRDQIDTPVQEHLIVELYSK
ncbi:MULTISPECIES: 30S ribosomal protein S4 [Desulfofundulus]|jgi:small subunit ribosomal protein S4|uniref:Small ribosomal subunit protein uS4 n=1 Tax=Desulfofundulus australicus DSM 11792 TaxID=1121425 RepID=A0A1M4Z049_9FIRM|nr:MULTISPECIES: 30S ribosomal protein S4 [Desulfofundulus]MBE3585297.1 30S ribosomal protein S4 [Thermoanaerobacter sp.]MCS5695146.1 30S ribosomal protein S4 [Desulfofundulus thermocisternus]MDK2888722.1 small subunit ribosomal protein [Thermoanaerobacter sp.]SHF11431.1 SSU ribosomal protein S4P [Desulfofundulus australicus DSM 11792]